MKWMNRGHEYDVIGNNFTNRKKIYIYGAGVRGTEIYSYLKFLECVEAFVDMNPEKQKNGFNGIKVISPEELLKLPKDDHIVIIAASILNTEYIQQRLLRAGYLESINCFTYLRFLDYYLPIYAVYAKNKIFFYSGATMPSTVCNLNCESCLNFNPYIKNHIVNTMDEMKYDIDIYFKNIDYSVRFQICGGEPFLYPQLDELVEYIGKHYRQQIRDFEVVTNGTILPSDKLCGVLKEYTAKVYLDDYTCSLPDKKEIRIAVIDKFKRYNVDFIDNKIDSWFDLKSNETDNSNLSEEELMNYFETCQIPWIELREGKIYKCNFSSFAMKAGLNTETENDYFDLEKVNETNKKEFLEFRMGYTEKGYVDFCKHCSGWCSINKKPIPVAVQMP